MNWAWSPFITQYTITIYDVDEIILTLTHHLKVQKNQQFTSGEKCYVAFTSSMVINIKYVYAKLSVFFDICGFTTTCAIDAYHH